MEVVVFSFFDDVEDLCFCFFIFVNGCEVDPVRIVVHDFGVCCGHCGLLWCCGVIVAFCGGLCFLGAWYVT